MANYTKATDFAAKDTLASGEPGKIVKGAEIDDEFSNIQTAIITKADIISPALEGIPTAPTADAGTNSFQLATTGFVSTAVTNERSATATLTNKTISGGTVTGITDLAVADGGTGASTAADARTNLGLVIGTDVAPVASPALTGTPTAPTATAGTNTTQLATTAFVQAALSALYPVGTIYTSTVATNPASTFGFGTWVAFGAGKVLVGQDTGDTSFDTLEETGGSKDAVNVSHNHTAVDAGEHTHSITQWTGSADDSQDTGGTYTGMNTSLPFTANPAGVVISTEPDHTHTINSAGESGTNKNLQPYVVVKMWKRTA